MEPLLMIDAKEPATSCVIWLHGLGATKYDFQDVALLLQHDLPRTRFVLPQAPMQPVTINAGQVMPSWYDISNFGSERHVDEADLDASAATVLELIEQQNQQGIKSANIVLAGFSQGGAVVYHTALKCYDQPLAGLIALSTYAPTIDASIELSATRLKTEFLVMHGKQDNVVPIEWNQRIYQLLQSKGAKVKWFDYPMGHQFCQPQFYDLKNWLQPLLQPV